MDKARIETRLRSGGDVPILDIVGEIDIYTTPRFKEAVSAAIEAGATDIAINLAGVTYMDSSGFGTLLSATRRLRPAHGSLYLFGCNEAILRMLQITRLNTIFGVYDTEGEALAAVVEARASASPSDPLSDQPFATSPA